MASDCHTDGFAAFMAQAEPPVRRALMSGFGPDFGSDAALAAFEYGWEHWNRVQAMANPAGYLYRVGFRYAAKKRRRWMRRSTSVAVGLSSEPLTHEPWIEPALDAALGHLTNQQRTAVVLIHGFAWTYAEVAELMRVRRSTVQRHVQRAMARLRSDLEVSDVFN